MSMRLGLLLLAFAFTHVIPTILGNLEVDALHAWRSEVADPKKVLLSWNPTMVNPCNWFHVICNAQNSVVRLDLGNAGLSGGLVPQLGFLTNLQYFEAFGNNLTGPIPKEMGRLKQLKVLDLHQNKLTGRIPASLGNLISLMYLRLNSNKLRGAIPREVLDLVGLQNLRVVNISDNLGAAMVDDSSKPIRFAVTMIIQDTKSQGI